MAPFASGTLRTQLPVCLSSIKKEVDIYVECVDMLLSFALRPWLTTLTSSCLLPEHGTPTSVAFVATDPNQVVVSFDAGETLLYDLNAEQSIIALETQTKDGMFRTLFVLA